MVSDLAETPPCPSQGVFRTEWASVCRPSETILTGATEKASTARMTEASTSAHAWRRETGRLSPRGEGLLREATNAEEERRSLTPASTGDAGTTHREKELEVFRSESRSWWQSKHSSMCAETDWLRSAESSPSRKDMTSSGATGCVVSFMRIPLSAP